VFFPREYVPVTIPPYTASSKVNNISFPSLDGLVLQIMVLHLFSESRDFLLQRMLFAVSKGVFISPSAQDKKPQSGAMGFNLQLLVLWAGLFQRAASSVTSNVFLVSALPINTA